MTVRRILAALALLAVAACGSPTSAPGPESTASAAGGFTDELCPDLLIVGVRGQQQSPDANGGLGVEIRRLTTALTQRVQADEPDTTVRRESIDYQSDPPADLDAYDRAVAHGAKVLNDRLDAIESRCTESDVAVIGFSMGAQLIHTALHDRPVGSITAVAMIADPQRDPVASYDVDAFGQAAPRTGSLGAGPEFTDLADRTVAFCAAEDDVCNHTPGESRTAVDLVHKHFYEEPEHVAAMAREIHELVARSA